MRSAAPFREYVAIIRGSRLRMRCLKWSLALLVIICSLIAVRSLTDFGHDHVDAIYGVILTLLVPWSLLLAAATGLDPSMREYPPLHDEVFRDSSTRESD